MRQTILSPAEMVAVFLLALLAAVCVACESRTSVEEPGKIPPNDTTSGEPHRPLETPANGVVFVERPGVPRPLDADPGHGVAAEGRIQDARAYSLEGTVEAVAFGEGSLWLTERFTWDPGPCPDNGSCAGYESGLLTRLDPETLEPVAGWKLRGAYDATVAFGAGSVWVTKGGSVVEIDPDTNSVAREIPVGTRLRAIAFGAGSVWAAGLGREVFRLDPDGGAVVERIEVVGREVYDVALGAGSLWVATSDSLAQIDPEEGEVVGEIPVPGVAFDVAAGSDMVWATGDGDGLVGVDPRTDEVADTLDLGGQAWDVEASTGSAWAVSRRSTGERSPPVVRLARVDPETDEVVGAVEIEGSSGDAAVGGGAAWLVAADGAYTGNTLTRATF